MATEAAHTPGPWESRDMVVRDTGLPFVAVIATTLIAKVYSTAYGDNPQAIANARLIAAAPDLLDALIHIEEYWNGARTDDAMSDALDEIVSTARAAIQKASGV